MSNRSLRPVYFLVLISLVGLPGCWEQWSASWFPQMKKQPAIQAYEDTEFAGHPQGFAPPDFSVPVNVGAAPVGQLDPWSVLGGQRLPGQSATDTEADALVNPHSYSDWKSLANGKTQYETYCAVCHGTTGLADGPVAKVYGGVLPVVGVVKARSDGHIYATIRYGRRRMPPYGRISEADRWDIVNYVRYLDEKGGRP